MRFGYEINPNEVIIEAIPEKDEYVGYRCESPYPKITLTETKLIFRTHVKRIHPDLLALLCIMAFYPFCRTSITFPQPVSVECAQAINSLPIYDVDKSKYIRTNKSFQVMNIDPDLISYGASLNKTTTKSSGALAYGGGLDSTATICLFPELYIIHEERISTEDGMNSSQKDDTKNFMRYLERGWVKWQGKTFCIESNNKDLCKPDGWTTWISCTATSVLLATDLSLGTIMLGSSIGSANLKNGQPCANKTPNMWVTLFNKIGLNLFSPIAGLTEISLGKIIHRTYPKWFGRITYCIKGKNGANCHKCWKCFRRDVIIDYITKGAVPINWEPYKEPHLVSKLETLSINGGPSLQWALVNMDHLPGWIVPYISPHRETFMGLGSWIYKNHIEVLNNIPSEYYSRIKNIKLE